MELEDKYETRVYYYNRRIFIDYIFIILNRNRNSPLGLIPVRNQVEYEIGELKVYRPISQKSIDDTLFSALPDISNMKLSIVALITLILKR